MKNLMKNLHEHVNIRKMIKKILETEENKLEGYLKHLENLEEARVIFQKASQITQIQLATKIEEIVSSALAAVFDNPYKFKVDFVSRRNATECDLLFQKNDKTYSPLNSCGYGAADIASLALRIAYWKLGDSRNFLAMDEPLRNLSKEKHPLASMMIQELSRMSGGLQILIVTHSKTLAESADKCFRVYKENNISYIKEIQNDTN